MLNRVRSLVLMLLLAACGTSALAWNNIGHMTVAYVAWQNLTPALQTRTTALIKLNPNYNSWVALIPVSTPANKREMYLFMIAATWADQIKGEGSTFTCNGLGNTDTAPPDELPTLNTGYTDTCMHKYWHFIDERYSPDGTTPQPVAIPTPNLQQKIDALSAALQTPEDDALKSYDLVWLEHLVGDVHQPLHCVSRFTHDHPTGDQGGNSILIPGKQRELHAYWDDILGNTTPTLYKDALLAEKTAKSLSPANTTLTSDATTADWVQESLKDAEVDTYRTPIGPSWGPYTPTTAYHANAVATARARIALAGIRLANLITASSL